jgi:hypothetical protein
MPRARDAPGAHDDQAHTAVERELGETLRYALLWSKKTRSERLELRRASSGSSDRLEQGVAAAPTLPSPGRLSGDRARAARCRAASDPEIARQVREQRELLFGRPSSTIGLFCMARSVNMCGRRRAPPKPSHGTEHQTLVATSHGATEPAKPAAILRRYA